MSDNLPLFYQNVTPLNRDRHGSWRIAPTNSYGFAAKTNSIYVAAVEFARAVREYPIIFGKGADDTVFPVALLGLKNGQNLFVDSKGNWQASYIPAYVRRYPFILAESSENGESRFTVCLDESYPGFIQNGKKGQPLFDENGEQTDLLQQSVEFLKDYQGHIERTRRFCEKLVELDLLEAVRADIALPGGEKQALGGFLCVSRNRLKQLDADKVSELLQSDQLELIYTHLLSLNNLNNLLQRGDFAEQAKGQSKRKVN